MKRRQRSVRELRLTDNFGENSDNFPILPSSPRNFLSETSESPALQIYSTLNSVFEILLPIEIGDLQGERNRDSDTSHSDNESGINRKYSKDEIHICKSCGFKEDQCGCSGCGDFEDAVIYTSNENVGQYGGGEDIKNDHMQIEYVTESDKYKVIGSEHRNLESDIIGEYTRELECVNNFDGTKEDNQSDVSVIHSDFFEISKDQDLYSTSNDEYLIQVEEESQEIPVKDTSITSVSGDESPHERLHQHLESNVESPRTLTELASVPDDSRFSVAETSKLLVMEEYLEPDTIAPSFQGDGHHSSISQLPVTDSAVLAKILEADEQALRTATLINQMKEAMKEYQEKDHLSEEDTAVLKLKQVDLMKKLTEFEEITERVQHLVGLADVSTVQAETQPVLVEEDLEPQLDSNLELAQHPEEDSSLPLDSIPELDECRCKDEDVAKFITVEDTIPKVIVCGTENHGPRIIVCEPIKTNPPVSTCHIPPQKDVPDLMLSLTGRLSESYLMQEKLATENAELEGGRYHLQEELLQKDNTVDALQRKVGSLQTEMRIISKENSLLTEKLAKINDMDRPSCCVKRTGMNPNSGCVCADTQIQQYNNTTNQLERQLNQIEGEVRCMQSELVQVQRERQQLEQQRKLINPATPPCPPCCPRVQPPAREPTDQAFRELKEQYARLQDDYKSKMTEVSSLRRENEKMKNDLEKSQEERDMSDAHCRCIQAQLRSTEIEAKKMMGSKEQLMEQEQQLNVARQRFREAQDELEELRGLVQDQTSQLEDYRNKYLQAQQQVEEQRRQIDVMEMDNSRISEQVNMEIQRVKNQFQEKLQELTPLPDILKATQMKLQEAQQMRSCAERNCDDMARELQNAKEKVMQAAKELEDYRNSQLMAPDEREVLQSKLEEREKKCNELKEENAQFRTEMARKEEMTAQTERRLEEKLHEVAQLSSQLDTVREESARQVARTKDRAETVRRSLQSQISDLERQLAQSRAAARSAQKDRDEIRQRMQCQINNLNENFDQAQMRIRSLQSHVNFLKTSYTNIFENNPAIGEAGTQSNYGINACDF